MQPKDVGLICTILPSTRERSGLYGPVQLSSGHDNSTREHLFKKNFCAICTETHLKLDIIVLRIRGVLNHLSYITPRHNDKELTS